MGVVKVLSGCGSGRYKRGYLCIFSSSGPIGSCWSELIGGRFSEVRNTIEE